VHGALSHKGNGQKRQGCFYSGKSLYACNEGGGMSQGGGGHRAFLRGIGTPNYNNHDSSCARNVQHSALSLTGKGRKAVAYDFKNSRHVVLQFRNIFESVNVQEVNDLMDAMEKGCKLSVIDIRANISASKAHNFMMIRPGLAHLRYDVMETEDPYPVKAYIAYRHDPLMGYPDPERLKKKWENLDLLVSVTFSWSDTAWHSDVVLPLSPYLERDSIIAT
jgi:anaerobic selenocysteine-containing dehydrogenase